jgi:hypothetical protein
MSRSVEKHDQDNAERQRSNSAYPPQGNSSGYLQEQRGPPPQYQDSRMGYAYGQDEFRNGGSNGYASEKRAASDEAQC